MEELILLLEETNKILSQNSNYNFWEIVSVLISGAALVFAILVPVRIANKQNKITLFEKRFSAYSDLLKLKSFADLINDNSYSFDSKELVVPGADAESEKYRRCSEIMRNFQAFFYGEEERPKGANLGRITLYTLRALELSLHTLPMLYSKQLPNKGKDANEEITEIFVDLTQFLMSLISASGPRNDLCRIGFINKFNAFFDKYADIFEKGIRL